ncbi:helix-turn-helix transcriptional regulator [Saccharopolyspora sp. TS4A08]|uniref:Helix-turn-helix transcriptional regulator n=1 Tax=Saccharopolyspora ipomoeae TaxID=3042027 RepID=A0ABT6PIL0_9PSEU|nr:helix-turn-helix transcriptional regulator [Saccharopolyspora sp. TS4A08]MDI2027837.1 helix-turn-helix transcriptional regulator [Saccharopolyspora sp. TS4A08]
MVRLPLTPDQVESGARVGKMLRDARAGRDLVETARAAGISPETLRKIESGRLPTPAFGTVVGLCDALDLPIHEVAEVWRSGTSLRNAS